MARKYKMDSFEYNNILNKRSEKLKYMHSRSSPIPHPNPLFINNIGNLIEA